MAIDVKKHVLVVDDASPMRLVLVKILKEIGFTSISEAENGIAALSKLKIHQAGGNEIGLVLLDWNMPKMTGLEVLKKIRADDALKEVPVLMVTAEARQENVVSAVKAGANNYIIKPFDAQSISEKIEQVISI